MRIGLDIMGGDYAPNAIVLGAIEACKSLLPGQTIVLIGDKEQALSIINSQNVDPDIFEYVHTTDILPKPLPTNPMQAFASDFLY